MAGRSTIAMELGRRRLRAIEVQSNGTSLDVQRVLVCAFPAELDRTNAEATGQWIGAQLRDAGFARGTIVLSLAREHVSLKKLSLQTTDPTELPAMTRLSLRRQLMFDPDTAVIDFCPLSSSETQISVLAAAVPRPVLDHLRAITKHAGYSAGRVSLGCLGTAALANSATTDAPDHGVLAIDATGDGIEFDVLTRHGVIFSRAAESLTPTDPEDAADSLLKETRRTWMSYRVAQDQDDVHSVLVLGPHTLTDHVEPSLRDIMQVPTATLTTHSHVNANGNDLSSVWPLAGLLLEPLTKRRTIDFSNPRRAPDRAAHRRQRVGMAVLILIAIIGTAWAVGSSRLGRLKNDLTSVRTQHSTLGPQYMQLNRDDYTLRHLDAWSSIDVDWLEHASHLTTISPPPGRIVFDSFVGSLTFRGVEYDAKAKNATTRWTSPREMTIVIDGEAIDRSTADGLRAALVETNLYHTSSTGGDAANGRRLPVGFTYRLRTHHDTPATRDTTPDGDPTPDTATAMRKGGES